jgi:hypothetical protein
LKNKTIVDKDTDKDIKDIKDIKILDIKAIDNNEIKLKPSSNKYKSNLTESLESVESTGSTESAESAESLDKNDMIKKIYNTNKKSNLEININIDNKKKSKEIYKIPQVSRNIFLEL